MNNKRTHNECGKKVEVFRGFYDVYSCKTCDKIVYQKDTSLVEDRTPQCPDHHTPWSPGQCPSTIIEEIAKARRA